MRNLRTFAVIAVFVLAACANKVLKYEHTDRIRVSDEFDKAVKIEVAPVASPSPSPAATGQKPTPTPAGKKKTVQKKIKKGKVSESIAEASPTPTPRRQPELESDIGFDGRRPLKDPFRVGEKIVHEVHYFKVSAGKLTLEVKPFLTVNGHKSYNFRTAIATSSLFESFYTVDDYVETLVDYETLVPNVFTLHVRESAQIKEAKSFFDHETLKATYWEKKVTEKDGEQEKRLEWELNSFAQNVFSAAFYLRNFHWRVGSENAFTVADDGKNLVFKGKAIRKEKLSTDLGEFDTIVIQPEITLKGKFQPVGDIFMWLSDDDRKYILRIESKIKIGTLISEVIEINPGQP